MPRIRNTALALIGFSVFFAAEVHAQNPIPFLNQPLQPSTAVPGGSSFTLRVNGTDFVSGANINWNGKPLTTSFVSARQLTATVPAADIATAGTASITVTNPAPGGGTSGVQFFSITTAQSTVVLTESDVDVNGSVSPAVIGDFNGDGKPDLVTANNSNSTGLFLLLGTGDGGFQAPKAFDDLSPIFLVSADFNGDGNLDLALFDPFTGIQVLLGKGDGSFLPLSPFQIPFGNSLYEGFAAADFNRDGKADLLFVISADGVTADVLFYQGNGDGTFAAPRDTFFANTAVGLDAVADFNQDGNLDFADAGQFLALGNGDGTFQQPQALNSGVSGSFVAAADMNGDGKLDLIVDVLDAQGSIAVLPGNGDGTFQNAISTPTGNTAGSFAFAVGDINGDGKPDVAVVTNLRTSPNLLILLGNGDGTFQAPQLYPVAVGPYSLLLADLNGDGKMDLIGPGGGAVAIFLQGSFPAFGAAPSSLTFGARPVGSTSSAEVTTVTNSGGLPLTISGISITGADAGDFAQTNTCGASLAGGASCTVSVTYTPAAAGTRSAAVSFTDNAPGSPQMIALNGTVEDFTIAANAPTSQTVTPGQAANYSITVSPLLGFNQTVTFSCSGTPAQSTCTFTPSSVTLDGTDSAMVNVALVTTAASSSLAQPASGRGRGLFAALSGALGMACLVVVAGRRGRRHLRVFYGLAFLGLLLIGMTMPACGGNSGSGSGGGGGGTPTGTYTVAVTGTYTGDSAKLTHSTSVKLVVQ